MEETILLADSPENERVVDTCWDERPPRAEGQRKHRHGQQHAEITWMADNAVRTAVDDMVSALGLNSDDR